MQLWNLAKVGTLLTSYIISYNFPVADY